MNKNSMHFKPGEAPEQLEKALKVLVFVYDKTGGDEYDLAVEQSDGKKRRFTIQITEEEL